MTEQDRKQGLSGGVKAAIAGAIVVGVLMMGVTVAMMFNTSREALRHARVGAAEHLIDQLTQAAKVYELDNNIYPLGDGTGSKTLADALAKPPGPGKSPYFEFAPGMRNAAGHIVNPVFADRTGPESILYYRNNMASQGQDRNPPRFNLSSFDLWGYGATYRADARQAGDTWEINNWQ